MNILWVVIAEGSRARIWDATGHLRDRHGRWRLRHELEHPESREHNQKLLGNRPDRIQHTEEKLHRGAREPLTVYEVEEDRFAKDVCALLERARSENAFDFLVIAAPPKFLGRLRRHLSPSVRARVKLEVPKDLARLEPRDLVHAIPPFEAAAHGSAHG
jgi:protein required for attachment to host cells